MAKNYTRPLAEVYQLLEVTQQATGDHLAACIVGPEYDLYRYGEEDDVYGETYSITSTHQTIAVDYAKDPLYSYSVDPDSVKLYADGILAAYSHESPTLTWSITADPEKCTLISSSAIYHSSQHLHDNFKKLPEVGDIVLIPTYNSSGAEESHKSLWEERTVVSLVYGKTSTGEDDYTTVSGVTVNSPITSVITAKQGAFHTIFCQKHSGYIPASTTHASSTTTNWTYAGEKVKVNKLYLDVNAESSTVKCPLVDGYGKLYPEFRVQVIPDDSEELITVSSVKDIQDKLGTISVENEIAYGAYCALKGSAGRAVHILRTTGTDVAAFKAAMKKTEDDSSLYSFVPLTNDSAVIDAVSEFNAELSKPEVKMWRRTIAGINTLEDYVVAEKDTTGKKLYATVTDGVLSMSTSSLINLQEIGFEGIFVSLTPGDKVVFSDGSTFTIKGGVGTKEALTTATTDSHTAGEVKFIKPATLDNIKLYIKANAAKYATRRTSMVFCDDGVALEDGKAIVVPNKFLAAEIAGIASAVVPQQSITHTEIQSISKATKMYTKYTNADLDDIASYGVLIVTQDTKNTTCYIRHQLTTEMDKGNLYYEESCTRNLDNISYAMADIVDKYIGKANVTTSALRSIKIDVTAKLTEFTQDTVNELVGPSLIDWSDLEVYQDPVFKDRIIITVKLYLPLPLNNIKMYEAAFVATVAI